jgi:hypothetical protein
LIITWLSKLLRIHEKVSKSDTNVATAFIARFIRRTLNMIMAESRVPSRAGTPGLVVGGNVVETSGMESKGLGMEGMIAGGGIVGDLGVEEDLFESLGLVSETFMRGWRVAEGVW